MKYLTKFGVLFLLFSSNILLAQDGEKPGIKAALFVFNRAGKIHAQHVKILENKLAARIADQNFQIIDRGLVVDSIGTSDGSNGQVQTELERELSKKSSAMRLAQKMGANIIMAAYLDSYGIEEKTYQDKTLNILTKNQKHTLRVSYRIAYAEGGGGVLGGTAEAVDTRRQTERLKIVSTDLVNGLIDDAAQQITGEIVSKQAKLKTIPKPMLVDFEILPKIIMVGGGLVPMPDIRQEGKQLQLEALATADVTLDGVSIGSAPGTLRARPGLHTIRIARSGFKPFERNVNIFNNQSLTIPLELTEAGFEKWKQTTLFLRGLDNIDKLTDAEVELLRKKATAIERFGFIFDLKVNTKEGIRVRRGGNLLKMLRPK